MLPTPDTVSKNVGECRAVSKMRMIAGFVASKRGKMEVSSWDGGLRMGVEAVEVAWRKPQPLGSAVPMEETLTEVGHRLVDQRQANPMIQLEFGVFCMAAESGRTVDSALWN